MPPPPAQPKIYHILHVDRLASIVADGCLWSDAEVVLRGVRKANWRPVRWTRHPVLPRGPVLQLPTPDVPHAAPANTPGPQMQGLSEEHRYLT